MRTYKNKTVKTLDKISCDVCGNSCTITESFTEHEYATIHAIWGYYSKQDGDQYNIEICEDCFNDVLEFIKNKRKQVLGCFNYPYDKDPLNGKNYEP